VAALALLVGVAGCGGAGGGKAESNAASGQAVSGPGFSFQAPKDWSVKASPTSAEARQDTSIVSVTVLPLVKRYRLALFPRVVKELDRVASTYAANVKGSVTSRRTVDVAGRRAREYVITHGDLVDRITFLLRGKRSFQLTCRWRSGNAASDACDQLAATFVFR
jgi:hypothetical protein